VPSARIRDLDHFMASASAPSKAKELDTGRGCDVCEKKITSFPMKQCSYCGQTDICKDCFHKIPPNLGQCEKYLHPLIESQKELEFFMEVIARTKQSHEDIPAPPQRKKPCYDTTQPPAHVLTFGMKGMSKPKGAAAGAGSDSAVPPPPGSGR